MVPPKRKQVTTITINTDASWHPKWKVGGWAFIIVCDEFRIKKSGPFKESPPGSIEAEIMCIGNAFQELLNIKDLPECTWLIINSDCKNGIREIRRQSHSLAKKVFKLWHLCIRRTGSKNNKFRHVKAHTGFDNKRSHANEWCDINAKKHMYKLKRKAQIANNRKKHEESKV